MSFEIEIEDGEEIGLRYILSQGYLDDLVPYAHTIKNAKVAPLPDRDDE